MKKNALSVLALILALAMLLCACGDGNTAASSQAAAPEAESAASVEAASQAESLSALEEETEIPEDPQELGTFLMNVEGEGTARDLELIQKIEIKMEDSSVTSKVSGRVREEWDGDTLVRYQSSLNTDGVTTEEWFEDGVIYRSDTYGEFKAPMTAEKYAEEQLATQELSCGEDGYDLHTGEKTDSGYLLTFGELNLTGHEAYIENLSELFESIAGSDQYEVTSLSSEGTAEFAEDLSLRNSTETVTAILNVAGMEIGVVMDIQDNVTCTGSDVQFSIPTDDEDFLEISDIDIPSLFYQAYIALGMYTAADYRASCVMSVEGDNATSWQDDDTIIYAMTGDGLVYDWTIVSYEDGAYFGTTREIYAGGEVLHTDDTSSETYTYDDASAYVDIIGFLSYYSDAFIPGISDVVMEQDGDLQKISFTMAEDYAEALMDAYLYDMGIFMDNAGGAECTGTVTVWINGDGLFAAQEITAEAVIDFDGFTVTATLKDSGQIVAADGDVVLPSLS